MKDRTLGNRGHQTSDTPVWMLTVPQSVNGHRDHLTTVRLWSAILTKYGYAKSADPDNNRPRADLRIAEGAATTTRGTTSVPRAAVAGANRDACRFARRPFRDAHRSHDHLDAGPTRVDAEQRLDDRQLTDFAPYQSTEADVAIPIAGQIPDVDPRAPRDLPSSARREELTDTARVNIGARLACAWARRVLFARGRVEEAVQLRRRRRLVIQVAWRQSVSPRPGQLALGLGAPRPVQRWRAQLGDSSGHGELGWG